MKTNKNRPGYITVEGHRLKTTGREITLHEVVSDEGVKGVAIKLCGKDINLIELTEGDFRFTISAAGFMIADVLCSILLVNGMSANDIHAYFSRIIDCGISNFDKRIPADMQDEAQRFADFVDKQGLSEEEMTTEKIQELAERWKNEKSNRN